MSDEHCRVCADLARSLAAASDRAAMTCAIADDPNYPPAIGSGGDRGHLHADAHVANMAVKRAREALAAHLREAHNT